MIPGNGGKGQFDVTEENNGRVARIGGALVFVGDVGEEDVGRHLVVSGEVDEHPPLLCRSCTTVQTEDTRTRPTSSK
jgi:hypothetical protein